MRLTDTRSRQVEEIVPATPRLLRVYACGPTVYRSAHVGNLRTFLLQDLIARTAEVVHGWRVRIVQNITDVGHLADDAEIDPSGEDKVLAEARRQGKGPLELARDYEEQFHRDCRALGIRPADAYPRASESIDLMLDLVQGLLDRGHAYLLGDGTVLFDSRSFPSYGEISGNRLDELRPGHRADVETLTEGKRFHADWALWKGAPQGRELVWDTPWGRGFPGWHVECSAMSLHHLGEVIDIHTGGIDLRFPHHEDERAQSNATVGHEVVRHWVHGEHLLHDGRKMAKSTGNVVLLDDVVAAGHDPLALRLFFLTGRYRQQMNLTDETLAAADRRLARWRTKVAQWAESPSAAPPLDYQRRVAAAYADDLDTPTALVALADLEKDDAVPDGGKFETFVWADRLLGLDLARDVGRVQVLPAGARELLDARAQARADHDWDAADRLRDDLAGLGVRVRDTADGQRYDIDG